MHSHRILRLLRAPLLTATLLVAPTACSRDVASADAEAPEAAGGVITLFTDSTELFMEHPALVVGEAGRFAVHLTDLTDFAPLRSGQVTLRFTPHTGGAPLVVVQESPRAPGIYGPAPVFERAGTYDLTIFVESPQARDSIQVGTLTVYAALTDAPLDDGGEDAGISFLKEQQWKSEGFRTAFATTGTLTPGVEVPGEIRAADGRMAEVVAPTGGLIQLGGAVNAPVLGDRVRRGQVLALMTPALGEAGATYADARARLREAEDEHERAKRLFAAEAIPERRLHEAEIRLEAARGALAGIGGGAVTADGSVEIVAPLSGIVTARTITAGRRIEAGSPLFVIVDPTLLWLTAHVPVEQASQLSSSASAVFLPEGSATPLRAGRLVARASTVDALSRTIAVTYEISSADRAVRVGAFARVTVPLESRTPGIIIPASAILEDDGRPYVYVQSSGELFERRELSLGGSDGMRTLVRAGLVAGDRVVTGAAYQVKLASLSTAVPTHGHEH